VLSRPVASWAQRLPGTIESDVEVETAELQMEELDTDVLVVVDADSGRLAGVLERRACLER
jgi:hypothetical protein